jgi:hypothetical protein
LILNGFSLKEEFGLVPALTGFLGTKNADTINACKD